MAVVGLGISNRPLVKMLLDRGIPVECRDRTPREKLLPVDALFPAAAPLTLTPEQERRCRCGNDFPAGLPEGDYRFYNPAGEFLALGTVRDGLARTVKSFFEV